MERRVGLRLRMVERSVKFQTLLFHIFLYFSLEVLSVTVLFLYCGCFLFLVREGLRLRLDGGVKNWEDGKFCEDGKVGR